MDLINIGAALAFAILHLLLYFFFRRERGNLYFALFALAFAGMTWGAYSLVPGRTSLSVDTTLRLTYTFGIVQAFALLRFVYLALLDRTPRVYYLLLIWGAAVVGWVWLASRETLGIGPVMYLALASTIELLRTVAVASRRPQRPGARVLYLGLGGLAVAGTLQSLVSLEFLPPGYVPSYTTGVVFFLLTLSVYLSRRFANTASELELQLEEVRRLSAKTLEQERKARRREVERRVLEAENERKGQELEEARRLQLSMLPREPPGVAGLDVAYRMLTATEVGGDYYDFRSEDDATLTLAIGDATGHGMNAGLMVASTKSLFQGLDQGLDLGQALARIDRGLRGMNLRRMAMSLSLARWRSGDLRVVAAGMPPALVRRADGRVEECVFSAPPLGTLRRDSFEERRLTLAPGDAALFATDGLAEALDADDRALGYPAVAEALGAASGESAEAIVAALLDRAWSWAGERPLADDLSLLVIRATNGPVPRRPTAGERSAGPGSSRREE